MKKFSIMLLVALLIVSLSGCGRTPATQTTPTTQSTTATTTRPTTEPTTMPTIIDPTIETNIPDPDVDTSMPDDMIPDGTDTTEQTTNSTNRNRDMRLR